MSLWIKFRDVTNQEKAIEQFFPHVSYVSVCYAVQGDSNVSGYGNAKCSHQNISYRVLLPCGTVYYNHFTRHCDVFCWLKYFSPLKSPIRRAKFRYQPIQKLETFQMFALCSLSVLLTILYSLLCRLLSLCQKIADSQSSQLDEEDLRWLHIVL